MRQIDPSILRPGMRLPMALYTRQGVKLLNPGVTITEAILEALSQSKWGTL